MKRKLTFLMLFMTLCSMISFGQVGTHWNEDVSYDYENNMTITSILKIDGVECKTTAIEIGAFDKDDKLRGSINLQYYKKNDVYIAFLQVYSDTNDEISFKLYDHDKGSVLNLMSDKIHFSSGHILGEITNPYVINFITPVAEVNGTVYGSLDAAIAAANANDEVKLLGDVTLSAELAITKVININLNGNEINGTVKLAIVGATITGTAANMTVTSGVEGYKAVYSNGVWALTAYNYVAQVGTTKYESLADAVAAAQDNDVIVLLNNVSDVDVTISKKVTLNLNEKTITDAAIIVSSEVLIKNGDIKNTNEPYPVKISSNGKLTIEGVDIEASKSDRAIWVDGGELIFNSGSILATKGVGNNKTSLITAIWVSDNSDVTINGGTITVDTPDNKAVGIYGNYSNANVTLNDGKISTSGDGYNYGINVDGDITVNGGEIVTNEKGYGYSSGIRYGNNYALVSATGDVTITGGNITTNGYSGYIVNVGRTYSSNDQTVSITGGTFVNNLSAVETTTGGHKAPVFIWEGSASKVTATITDGDFTGFSKDFLKEANAETTLAISGGTFDREIASDLIAPGFKLEKNADGTYGVVLDPAYGKVAKIGDTYYETVDAAFAAAQDSENVEIFVAGTYALSTSGKNITITGAVDGVVFDNIGPKNMGGANVTFNNVTFDYYPNVDYTGLQHSGNLVYNNCTINGQVFLYGTSETFNECTFNQNSANAYNVWTYGAKDVDFIECTFNSVGKSVLIYSEQSDLVNDVTVTDCDFIASAPVEGKAAIEMNSEFTAGINLTIDAATTATGFGSGNVSGNSLWNNKKGNATEANNDITVVVNDETVLAPLTLVAAAGGTNYTSLQAAYNAVAADGTITILNDVAGAGLVIDKNVTIDFGGKTYTVNQAVGSAGTETLGFQILKNNTVTLMSGTLTSTAAVEGSKEIKMLIQNYADLTLTDMNLVDNTDHILYALSNNSGTSNIAGATNITTDAVAFDVYDYTAGGYAVPTVNVSTTGKITGAIEVSETATLNISAGTFTVKIAEAWCADGFIPVKNADDTWTVKEGKFIAQTETGAKFETLQEAVNAGTTVTLLDHATGAGVVINKDVTIDFNGKTYTVNQAVGSAGTETLGFQILKNNTVTLMSGTLTSTAAVEGSKEIKMLIQNYADLTLTDMNLVDNTDHILYALSNNSGTSNINGATSITTTDAVAFDVYDYTAGGYAVPTVNVSTTGKITGAIEVSVTATLNISAGTFTVEIAEAWCADGFIPKDNGDGTYGVEPGVFVARVNGKGYTSINAAIEAAQAGETVTILAGNYEQNLNINEAITVVGERDAEGNNLVTFNGKLNITANGAIAKNLNVNNGGSTAGYINAKDVLVEGCDVTGGNGFYYCYTAGTVTFKDSKITGATYGIHFDGSEGGNIVIDNCDITGWTSFASTITNVAISNTEFLNGNYNQLRFYQNAQMTDCKFNEAMTIDFGKDEVKAEFEGCAVVDTEGNETEAPLTDVIYLGDIAEMGIDVTIDNETVVVESRITRVNEENKEEHRYFLELTDALADVKDGETITLFADINEAVNVKTLGKEIVFDGNDFTMTAGMSFGNDDNNSDNGKITVKNVNFANANAKAANNGLTLIELAEVTVDNCNFTNITGDAIAVISDNLTETITITNNVIDGATGAGINLRTPKVATVEDNVIKNVGGNAMTFQHGSNYDAEGDIIVTGNLMENWANNAAEGRAIRLASGSKARTFTIENNAMVKANAPEEFVKITTSEDAQATISIDKNYWNGQSPLNENVYLAEGVFPTNYYGEYQYANEILTLSNLVSINYVAQVNGVKYPSLAAAVEAAQAGETVTLLGDATGAGVVINKDITIDFGGNTYTVNQAVGSAGTETLGFQILKNNNVTLKNGTLTSTTPVVTGKEVKMLIQNYANLTLTNMNLDDNTDHIQYVLSNNSGTSSIEGATNITTDAVAFDVYDYTAGGYAVPTVNVSTTGTIAGAIVVSESISNNLNISAGTFTVEIAEAWCADGFIPKDNGNGTYGVEPGVFVARVNGKGYTTIDAAFAAAQDSDEVKILVAGTYALTTSGKDITITGAVDGVVFDNIGAKNMGGANVTFNNVTFDYYPNVNYTGLQHSGDLVYNNCTINGQVFLYGTSETFNECIFNQNSADAYNVWTYGAKDVDFIECTFNSVGKSVLIYAEGASIFNNVNVTKCTFNASAPVDGKAAIEMDSSLTAGINLTIDGETTVNNFGSGNVSGNSLWNNKKGNATEANNDITVVVNDETVLAPLTLVAATGGTNYTSLQAAYNAVAANGTITILNDVTGAGLVIDKNVTIDFNEKTYTFNEGVGSGTLTSNGFQILQGNTVVLNNGKLEVAAEAADKFYILVQNYANLTVKDMNLDGTNLDKWSLTDGDSYVLSNNSGTVTITGATNITANNEGDKAFAFDVCKYGSYAAPTVNVNTTGTIAGKIEVSSEIPTNLNISGGTFTVEIAEAWCADGFIPVKNADDTWTVKEGKFIAQTETGAKFETLQEAVNAGTTVTLLGDATGAGVVINKDVTIDFGGFTYTVNQAVGSAGTETLGFQILKNNNVTLKNGTLTSTTPVVSGKDVKMLIQNYANLTLTDMNLVDNTDHILYALSNNSGISSIEGATNITTDEVAFDVYDYTAGGYAVPTVNVSTTGKITGAIEVSVTATLNISAGTFTNEIYEEWCAEFFSPYYNETDKTWTVVLTGGVQTIQLGNGWNWFSSYVDMSGENGLATLQDALGTSGRQIKSQVTNHFSSYSVENQEWYGNSEFTSLHKEKMYMIQTSTDVELELSGDFIDYEKTPIQVNKGWNWISYPVNETVDINEALKNLKASDNDIVKMHGSTFATYYNGEWLAYEEMTLEPGQGYMYYRKASDATSFVYNVPAENNNNKTNVAATDYRWTSASAEYANNMTITAMLSVDGELVRGDYEIAALVNGEVRGNARPVYIESLDAYMLFMTVFGDDVEEVTFRYYDVETGAEFDLDNNIIYSTDAIVGSIEEPYMFNLDILNIGETSIDEINVYPNPTTIGREISLDATCDTVEVFNALGVKVAEYHNVDSIDAIETAGIYVIRVTIDGNARNCRLVVK